MVLDFNPMTLWYSRDVKPYSVVALLAAALLAVYLLILSKERKSLWFLAWLVLTLTFKSLLLLFTCRYPTNNHILFDPRATIFISEMVSHLVPVFYSNCIVGGLVYFRLPSYAG